MEHLINIALESKEVEAKFFPSKNVIILEDAREKCRQGCPLYGKNQSCPPASISHIKTKELIDIMDRCILIKSKNKDILDDVLRKITKILKEENIKSYAFGAKICQVCQELYNEECTFPNCKHKDEVIPQMSGCGIDVVKTAVNNGFNDDDFVINKDGQNINYNDINFFGMVIY